MNKCQFNYRPTFIYLHTCDSIEDIENENFEFYAESDANSTGTCEYKIIVDDDIVFKYSIPLNHPEEEDLSLDELEGKILVREINVYSPQSIDAFYDEEEDLEPSSVFYGLAYSFNGVIFGEEEDEINELEEYVSDEEEEEERYFEYYLIKDGKPELIENI
jgi:hypothetical protein